MNTVTTVSFDKYLQSSGLPQDEQKKLRSEFEKSGNSKAVYDKAVSMSGRKAMTKVPRITHK